MRQNRSAGIADLRAQQVQLLEPRELSQILHAFIGDFYAVKVENLEVGQVLQIFDALIRDQRAHHGEPPQVFHSGERGHGLVRDVGVVEIESFQIHQRRKTLRILHRASLDAEILEL